MRCQGRGVMGVYQSVSGSTRTHGGFDDSLFQPCSNDM